MPKKWLKYLLISCGVIGTASAAASFGVAANLPATKGNFFTITKKDLMKNFKVNLSSLNNYSDIFSVSIKEDMQMALSQNYRGMDVSKVDMKFYYGGSSSNPEIIPTSHDIQSILYFTVKFHSQVDEFFDTYITFDYRPVLKPWTAEFNGYKNANIYVDKSIDSFSTFGDVLNDTNNYLNTDYIKKDFAEQWKAMGVVPDKLLNSDKLENLNFTPEFIKYVNNLGIKRKSDGNYDLSLLDEIPESLKSNIFKNFDSSLTFGYSKYYQISSSDTFKPIDEKYAISNMNKNYKELKLKDFERQIKGLIQSSIYEYTDYQILPEENDLNVVFKKSYKDKNPAFTWDTQIKDIDTNYLWLEINGDKSSNPFLQYMNDPGFHIYISK